MIKACPNIEELHINFFDIDTGHDENIDCFNLYSNIQCPHLTSLDIAFSTLCDGSYLPLVGIEHETFFQVYKFHSKFYQIIEKCPKLERLSLRHGPAVGHNPHPYRKMNNVVSHLVKCLPKATKLRDLRWAYYSNNNCFISKFLKLIRYVCTGFSGITTAKRM